jgi:hypothetical protein
MKMTDAYPSVQTNTHCITVNNSLQSIRLSTVLQHCCLRQSCLPTHTLPLLSEAFSTGKRQLQQLQLQQQQFQLSASFGVSFWADDSFILAVRAARTAATPILFSCYPLDIAADQQSAPFALVISCSFTAD